MSYKVIVYFNDLQDKNYPYKVGDVYPRKGVKPSEERIAELLSNKNKRGTALIEKIADTKETPEEKGKTAAKAAK